MGVPVHTALTPNFFPELDYWLTFRCNADITIYQSKCMNKQYAVTNEGKAEKLMIFLPMDELSGLVDPLQQLSTTRTQLTSVCYSL
jgi:hypothetical protein